MIPAPMSDESETAGVEPLVRAAVPEDEPRLLSAHRAAAGANRAADPRLVSSAPPSEASAAWLARAPGRVRFLAEADGRLLAAAGGLRIEARVDGERQSWGVLTDAFAVDADARPALLACLRAYGQAEGGLTEGVSPVLLATVDAPGVHHALRDALGFEVLRDLLLLSAPPARLLAEPEVGLELREGELAPGDREALVGRALGGRTAVRLRDPARVGADDGLGASAQRVVLRDGEPVAWAALRGAGSALVLHDWLVAPDDHLALRALVRAAAEAARTAGATELRTTCADTQAEWLLLQEFGLRVGPLPAFVLARTWKRPVDPTWLYERWSFTPADLCLVAPLAGLDTAGSGGEHRG